jgi:hypothetical protein
VRTLCPVAVRKRGPSIQTIQSCGHSTLGIAATPVWALREQGGEGEARRNGTERDDTGRCKFPRGGEGEGNIRSETGRSRSRLRPRLLLEAPQELKDAQKPITPDVEQQTVSCWRVFAALVCMCLFACVNCASIHAMSTYCHRRWVLRLGPACLSGFLLTTHAHSVGRRCIP